MQKVARKKNRKNRKKVGILQRWSAKYLGDFFLKYGKFEKKVEIDNVACKKLHKKFVKKEKVGV